MSSNTSPGKNTFEDVVPHRPGIADFNGNAKENDEREVPNPQTDPSAEEWTTICALLIAMGGLVPLLRFYVAGNALLDWKSLRGDAVGADFTLTHIATGQYAITWPVGDYPTASGQPQATINAGAGAGQKGMILAATTTYSGLPGVLVYTFDATGAAADRDFQVSAF